MNIFRLDNSPHPPQPNGCKWVEATWTRREVPWFMEAAR